MTDNDDSRLPNELSGINNELVNLQRELAKKNAELRQAHDRLEIRVEERTRDLQQAREEAERAAAAKSDFLSRMSHELRTPMNSILGFAQIMEMDTPSDKQAVRLGHITQAGRQLLELIDGLLDMAHLEAETSPTASEPTPQKAEPNE